MEQNKWKGAAYCRKTGKYIEKEKIAGAPCHRISFHHLSILKLRQSTWSTQERAERPFVGGAEFTQQLPFKYSPISFCPEL